MQTDVLKFSQMMWTNDFVSSPWDCPGHVSPDSKDTCDVSILCSATINSRDKWVMNLNKSSCPVFHFIISVIFVSLGLNRRTIESAHPGHALLRTVQRMCPAVQHIHVM